MRLTFIAAAAAFVAMTAAAHAEVASPSPTPDYAAPVSWLCLPGRADACAADQTATVVAADGALTRETFRADPDAPIDCFYIYPTVSNDPTPNSDMTANVEETYVVAQQFARFAGVCRPFAPLYRQVTLTALRALLRGQPMAADRAMAYTDVLASWRYYLAHHNNGRGVVLIGHSQGAGILTALIANEIDGKPVQSKIVSALILGSNVPTPRGQPVGGVFLAMPTCTSADQAGCVISYVSFRDTVPPPASSRFGVPQTGGPVPLPAGVDFAAACVNPAALLHGTPDAPLHSYLAAASSALVSSAQPRVWSTGKTVDTPFVSAPGLLNARCVSTPTHTYLSIHVNADASDPRTDTIAGDVVIADNVQPDWGLHLIDVNLTIGDLVELVGRQSAAYRTRK